MPTAARKPAPVLEPVIPIALVDEYGDLTKLRDDFAPTERAHRKALEQLKALVRDAEPDAAFTAKGERYTLVISARGMEAKPNVAKARKLLGVTAFMEVVTVTKTALERWLLKPQIEEICDVTQTGARSFDPVPLGKTE
jgi:hypothetical protein